MAAEVIMATAAVFSAVQGFQAYQQGKAQAEAVQKQAMYQSRISKQTSQYNVQVEQNRAALEKQQLQKKQRIFFGQTRTKAAVTGATLGSFEDTFESNKSESLQDLAIIDYESRLAQSQELYAGQVGAYNAQTSGEFQAKEARARGNQALISGLSNAASMSYTAYKAGGA